MAANILTQSKLKELLYYDPDTGVFTWINPKRSEYMDKSAGCLTFYGYIKIVVARKQYLAHRLAWFYVHGVWPNCIDHENHDRTDNRISNLKNGGHLENNKNSFLRKDNNSGVTGVFMKKQYSKWGAQIKVNGENKHLGYFDDKFEAICARLSANNKYRFHANHGAARKEKR